MSEPTASADTFSKGLEEWRDHWVWGRELRKDLPGSVRSICPDLAKGSKNQEILAMSSQVQLNFTELKALVIYKHISYHSMGQMLPLLQTLVRSK